MALIIQIALIAFVLLTGSAQAATYYFSNAGSDGNNCTTTGTPCATVARAQALAWNPGDQFLFRCGDIFRYPGGNPFTTQGSGASGNPILIGAYGTCTTTDDYPVLTRSELVTGFESVGTNLWATVAYSGAEKAGPNWFFDKQRAAWNEFHDAGCPSSMTEEYEVCYNSARTIAYVRTTAGDPDNLSNPGVERVRGDTSGATILVNHEWIEVKRINMARTTFCLSAQDGTDLNVLVDDSECLDTCYQNNIVPAFGSTFGCWGMRVFGAAHEDSTGFFRITNSRFQNLGRDGIDIDDACPDGEITIDNNTLTTGYNHNTMNLGKDMGAENFCAGTVTISNNTSTAFCNGISWGDGNDGGFQNLRVLNNIVKDKFNPSTPPARYVLSAYDCDDFGQGLGGHGNPNTTNVFVQGNQVMRHSRGLHIDNAPGASTQVVRNNAFIDNVRYGIQMEGTVATREISANVFSRNGAGNGYEIFCLGANCLTDNITVRWNYFDPLRAGDLVALWGGGQYTLSQAEATLAAWATNNEGNATGASPANLFADRANDDFTPGAGSPLIDGDSTFCGAFNGAACDIGAIETGTEPNTPVPTPDSAIIRAATPTLFEVCFATANLPMLPASGCTGISLTGTSAAPASCVRDASNNHCMDITLNQAPVGGETITMNYSQASGNITSNTGTEVVETSGFAVTNNVGKSLLNSGICTSPNSFAAGRALSNSFDGDTTTEEGSSGSSTVPEYTVTCDLGADHTMGVVRIFGDSLQTWWCGVYDLEYSTNGVDYTTWVTDANCKGNQWWEQNLNMLTARYLRWTITGNVPATSTQWRELEAYGIQSGTPPDPPQIGGVRGLNVTGTSIK